MALVDPVTAARHRAAGWWRDGTILDDVARVAAAAPERLAIAGHHGDGSCERLTFGDLARYTERFAAELVRLGVQPGEVVSLQLPNWWEFAALHLACTRIGAVTNPILPVLRHREVRFILTRTRSRVCVAPTRFRRFDHGRMLLDIQRETPTLEHLVLVGDDGPQGAGSIAAWYGPPDDPRSPSGPPDGAPAGADSPAQIIFTSGTTG
ncbi:MAG TPA: AMP-binding protein, partial [Acidimicrobiia bacterium]|nr:AMP-binding protein [Acidimicrobiia bacterium]